MRSAKEWKEFPYNSKRVCYMELSSDGKLTQLDSSGYKLAYENTVATKSNLYAVCPGDWRSDLFVIDDLNSFADAFGIPRPDDHTHHITWKLSSIDDGKSSYATVDIVFNCDCKLSMNNLKKIANDLREQKGWEMATSTGYSGGYSLNGEKPRYTISVKRKSL